MVSLARSSFFLIAAWPVALILAPSVASCCCLPALERGVGNGEAQRAVTLWHLPNTEKLEPL
eukprot:9503389-Pyramimonas_sp.AAC.1